MEGALISAWIVKLLNANLIKLFKGEYALTILMLNNKDIFDNWIVCCMCGDYCPMNKHTYFDNMPCFYWKIFLMPQEKLKLLIPCTCVLVIINYH